MNYLLISFLKIWLFVKLGLSHISAEAYEYFFRVVKKRDVKNVLTNTDVVVTTVRQCPLLEKARHSDL